EDGIRDATVTGVQTCALPISASTPDPFNVGLPMIGPPVKPLSQIIEPSPGWKARTEPANTVLLMVVWLPATNSLLVVESQIGAEIGRASCRERVKSVGEIGVE